jgi:hypothetical protein
MNVDKTLIRSGKRIGSQPRFDLLGERCISLGRFVYITVLGFKTAYLAISCDFNSSVCKHF